MKEKSIVPPKIKVLFRDVLLTLIVFTLFGLLTSFIFDVLELPLFIGFLLGIGFCGLIYLSLFVFFWFECCFREVEKEIRIEEMKELIKLLENKGFTFKGDKNGKESKKEGKEKDFKEV